MINILRRIGTTLVTAALIVATGGIYGQANSAPLASPRTIATAKSYDCAHQGYRGNPAYDAHCLTTGTPRNAADLWRSVPTGTKGHEHDDMTTQRNLCKYGHRHGGTAAWAREMVGDMTYDNYRNNHQVNAWVGQDATLTCAQLGYHI